MNYNAVLSTLSMNLNSMPISQSYNYETDYAFMMPSMLKTEEELEFNLLNKIGLEVQRQGGN